MPFEDVMGTLMRWATATEALAALGAELSMDAASPAPPEIASALRGVTAAAGLSDVDQLPPPQRAMLGGVVRMMLHQAVDLVDQPGRAPGWAFTDPVILDGMGRGSAMIPAQLAAAHPDLADVTSFLDVGTGVGFLAIAAAGVWPKATIVGIDPWPAALERATANVALAQLEGRVTLRPQRLEDIDETAAYDAVWVPTFFLTEGDLEKALPAAVRALRPGGWIALGRNRPPGDQLAAATAALRWVRAGGGDLPAERAAELLEQSGCVEVHTAAPAGPSPIELVLGQRPAA